MKATTIVKTQSWMATLFNSQPQPTQKKTKPKVTDKYEYPGLITDRPHITVVAGKKGSGKSHLACRLLLTSFRFKYDHIIFVSPTFRAQYDGLWSKLSPDGITGPEQLTEQLIETIMKTVSAKGNGSTLLILDDVGEEFRKISPRTVNMLVSNSRHYKLSIICLHQRLTQAPPILRANADVVIAFSACSYVEVECMWKMVATTQRKAFQLMFNDATQEPHSYLVSMVDKGGRLRFYKKDFRTELLPSNYT
jgi:hypothetical protein